MVAASIPTMLCPELACPTSNALLPNLPARHRAVIYSTIQSCKTHRDESYAYLKDVLTRLPSMTNRQIPAIMPKAWARSAGNVIDPTLKQQPQSFCHAATSAHPRYPVIRYLIFVGRP